MGVQDSADESIPRPDGAADRGEAAAAIPAGAARAPSTALEVNLRRTAVEVVIPAEQKVLLEITSHLYGVQENTKKLLREINHRFVGWPETVEDLHRCAMGDFAHYVRHERAPEAIEVFNSLYARAVERADPPPLRETALRYWLYYLEKLAGQSGEDLGRLLLPLERALARLGAFLREIPSRAVILSPRLRRLARTLLAAAPGPADEVCERSLELLCAALRHVYDQWLRREDPADWWSARSGSAPGQDPLEVVATISHARLRASRDRLDRLTAGGGPLRARAAEIFELPDNAQMERGYLEAASCAGSAAEGDAWRSQLARVRWLIKVLSMEDLASVHEQALFEINRSYADLLRGSDCAHLEQFVRETFATLRRSDLSSSQTAFHLVSNIGREVLATGDRYWAEVVIDEILQGDFPRPEFSGFTDEWQVQVNPAHLRGIRTYLEVIEANPRLASRLLAALVVHLQIGGVFIADTDLFQKDVSRLLNSGIGASYHQVKHLLKLFPVYFNDIGAEGELREVSTRIDEITGRSDPLCHFLRKQSHVESNPLLLDFIEAIGRFWATGDRAPLRPYVPAPLFDELDIGSDIYTGMHRILSELVEGEDVGSLFELDLEELRERLAGMADTQEVDRDKAVLLVQLRQLLGRKYELDHDDLLDRLSAFHHIDRGRVEELRQALEDGRDEPALEILLEILEELKRVIVSEQRTEAVEDIYHKRHVAVGIPSMYGQYREQKFEAMGLTFRVESLANVLFERMITESNLEYVTRSTLRRVAAWLRLLLRSVRVDGCRGRGLAPGIAMLEQALVAEGISVDQYINIFQFISRSIEQLVRIRFLDVYESVLQEILGRMLERGIIQVDEGHDAQQTILKISEGFLRGLISRSFGLQHLDNLVGRVIRTLVRGREKLDRSTLHLLMTYDAERCCVEIDRQVNPRDGTIYLGNKGYLVKRLAHDGFPVPHGFIVTTEVFRCRAAILAYEALQREGAEMVQQQIARLERLTGCRFGDPRRPLLLSVRSGAAISMPGMLDTFLNVGINSEIAEGFAARSGSPWAAWDAYRRFLQSWGMSYGIGRNLFDNLMREAKTAFGAEKKSHLPGETMKELALRYRELLLDHRVHVVDDPVDQFHTCMELVLRSWHSEKARVYRREMQIAEEWGTAVIVQNMVYGNLDDRSGTGVILTRDPRRASGDLQLYGDFIVQGQGDDVVSGLVETFPITEQQRLSEAKDVGMSLQKDFPAIYEAMARHARSLILDHGMFHQEIEFTFESDDPKDLYILQTRDIALSEASSVSTFVPSEALERSKLATGIGAGSGAMSGRVAHTAEDIAELQKRFPEDQIILLRPDTVPDDIPLILQANGMLTATGGATSHAAVAAQRLGRTCVVGCRMLHVDEERSRSELAGRTVATGDFLSINGSDGSVYLGKHPITTVRRHDRRETAEMEVKS